MPPLINLIKQKFGRLKVLKRVNNAKDGHACWLCECDCGQKTIVIGNDLRRGKIRSCGCLHNEGNNTTHGYARKGKKHELYNIWKSIIQRCINPNNKSYPNYGGRGITVCKRWMKFPNFLNDMGERPSELTLERKNNNKNYCKSNCEWATRKKQARNTRKNRLKTYNGKKQCIATWAEEYQIPYMILWQRIYKLGWLMKKALTTPVRKQKKGGLK